MIWLWLSFVAFVIVMMVLDLRFVGRRKEGVSIATALSWTGICVLLALAFTPAVYFIYERHMWGFGLPGADAPATMPRTGLAAATAFLQGWLLEYSLSVDNIFVFAVIFRHFKVPDRHQHRVLAWGIIAAMILRGVMIASGTWLVGQFHWLLYVAAAFLLYTAWGMVRGKDDEFDPDRSWLVRIARRVFPVTPEFHGDKFFIRTIAGDQTSTESSGAARLTATPLFLVLIVLNVVDIAFALDSIPAILGVTTDPFLVFTSNVFAILGLRSLYFVLAGMMHRFKYLNVSLAVILAFVGIKMLIDSPIPAIGFPGLHVSSVVSLGVIVTALATGVAASHIAAKKPESPASPDAPLDGPDTGV